MEVMFVSGKSKQLTIITGQGKHNVSGKAVIKEAVSSSKPF